MKIYKSKIEGIQYKWQADKTIQLYDFCYDMLEKAFNEDCFLRNTYIDEDYDGIFNKIECHLIASHVNLFYTDCYDLIDWVKPPDIYFLKYLIQDTLVADITPSIVSIMLKSEKYNSKDLSVEEKKTILFCKTLMLWGIFYHYKECKFDPEYKKKKIRLNKLCLYKFKRDLALEYDKLSEDASFLTTKEYKIIHNSEINKIKAITYFKRINQNVFNNRLFEESYMFDYFINSLAISQLNTDIVYQFNKSFNKKLIVNVFNLSIDLFSSGDLGPFDFIKNSSKFIYNGTVITGSNWHPNGIKKQSEDERLLADAISILTEVINN